MKKFVAAAVIAATGASIAPAALAEDAQSSVWRGAETPKVWLVHPHHRGRYYRDPYYYDEDYYYYKERKRAQNRAIARDFINIFGAIAIEGIRNERYRKRRGHHHHKRKKGHFHD